MNPNKACIYVETNFVLVLSSRRYNHFDLLKLYIEYYFLINKVLEFNILYSINRETAFERDS